MIDLILNSSCSFHTETISHALIRLDYLLNFFWLLCYGSRMNHIKCKTLKHFVLVVSRLADVLTVLHQLVSGGPGIVWWACAAVGLDLKPMF
jgi:hypothetical protein